MMSAVGTPTQGDPHLLSSDRAGPAAVRGGVMRTGSFLAGSLLSVAAAALLFRHLGVRDTGRYTTAISLSAVVIGVTDLGLTTIGMRELAVLRGEPRAQLARNLLGMRLALTAIGVLIVDVFAFAAYGRLLGLGVLIAGGGALIQSAQTTLTVPLMAGLRLGWVSLLELVRQAGAAGFIVVLVLAGGGLLSLLAVTAAAALIVLPPTIALVRRDIPVKPSFDTRQWRGLVGPVLAYSAAVVTATIYLRVALILVSLTSNANQLGYFSVSYRVVEALLALPALLVGAAFPIFAHAARGDPARLARALSRVFEAALIVGVWLSLSLAVGAHLAVEILAGAKFQAAASVLAVQGIAVGAVFVSSVWAYALLSLHLHRVILLLNLSLLTLMAAVVALMASLDGAQGAALATASVEITAAIAGAIALTRARPELRPTLTPLPKVAIAAAIAALPALLTDIPVAARVLICSGLYFAALLCLRALPSDLGELLFSFRGDG